MIVHVPATRVENQQGALWLIADMSLNIWALTIVKAMGLDYPVTQIMLLRAGVGLVLILPWAWARRRAFLRVDRLGLHGLRIALSVITLATSFFAIARVPFALFSAMNFTRPILLMLLASLLLRETISRPRWLAALAGLGGAMIAMDPWQSALSWGLAALIVTVLAGTFAVIITRRLKGTPAVVMMTFYTAGLTVCVAPFAVLDWTPVAPYHWPLLLAIGVFAQGAQFCFIKAHWLGDAGVLAPISYLSLVLSTGSGFLFFGEVPSLSLMVGAMIILASVWYVGKSA